MWKWNYPFGVTIGEMVQFTAAVFVAGFIVSMGLCRNQVFEQQSEIAHLTKDLGACQQEP